MPRGVRAKEPSQPGHKVCVGCDTEKPFADFTKHSASKDGLNPRCRLCTQAQNNARCAANPPVARVHEDLPASKVCRGCHVDKPLDDFTLHKICKYGRNSRCRECTQSENNARRADNLEHVREQDRNRYHSNPQIRETMKRYRDKPEVREAARVRAKDWYWDNTDRAAETAIAYREANRERLNAASRARYWADPEAARATTQRWQANNPDKVAAGLARRAQRELDAYVEDVPLLEIAERDGWRCHLCRKKVDPKFKYPHPMSATRDHLIPISHGGLHEKRNVKLAHWDCNRRRHDGGTAQLRLIG